MKKLSLSYTFVRSMEEGLRLPSDEIVEQIATKCEMDVDELILATYCDRSPLLARVLRVRGIISSEEEEPPAALPAETSNPAG